MMNHKVREKQGEAMKVVPKVKRGELIVQRALVLIRKKRSKQ